MRAQLPSFLINMRLLLNKLQLTFMVRAKFKHSFKHSCFNNLAYFFAKNFEKSRGNYD